MEVLDLPAKLAVAKIGRDQSVTPIVTGGNHFGVKFRWNPNHGFEFRRFARDG
jgi:hypothetical protein